MGTGGGASCRTAKAARLIAASGEGTVRQAHNASLLLVARHRHRGISILGRCDTAYYSAPLGAKANRDLRP
jgi:hypothetical protein